MVVEEGKIKRAEPANGRTNEGTLCLKGHYEWDYLNDPQLLTPRIKKPMIRKNGQLVEVTWDEAIKFVARKLTEIKNKYGADSIMGTGRVVKAREKGAKIIVVDPRVTESVRISDLWLQLKGGTNMALVNGFANTLINENLYNKDYVAKYTEGFEEYKSITDKYTPEYVNLVKL